MAASLVSWRRRHRRVTFGPGIELALPRVTWSRAGRALPSALGAHPRAALLPRRPCGWCGRRAAGCCPM